MKKNALKIHINKEKELSGAARQVLQWAGARRKFTLTGDLGAGKTTFTQYICRELGVRENVTSPTFSLVNEYTYLNEDDEVQIFRHLDLYRLKNIEEALDIGIEDYLYDEHYCFIEWPEIVRPLLPDEAVHVKISMLRDSSRKILLL